MKRQRKKTTLKRLNIGIFWHNALKYKRIVPVKDDTGQLWQARQYVLFAAYFWYIRCALTCLLRPGIGG